MDKSFRDKLMDVMKWEDSVLQKYIEKARLEKWTRAAAESVQAVIADFVDQETEAGAAAHDDSNGNGNGNGAVAVVDGVRSLKLNGRANGKH